MDKETYQDVMWLFHDLGQHLKSVAHEAPEGCDTRELLRRVVQNHQPGLTSGRNPFNWLKELQTALNFWHHLRPESDVPEDDIWRDLDTLERAAKFLNLDSEFVGSVHGVKERIWAEKDIASKGPSEIEIRSWIQEEVAQQLGVASSPATVRQGETGELTEKNTSGGHPESSRGEHADRVRTFVIDAYIEPARTEGLTQVRIRAGDVDKALGFRYRRLPLICAALRSRKFLEAAHVKLLGETGPPSGASTTTTFLYELEPTSSD